MKNPKTTISGITSILLGILLIVKGNTETGIVAVGSGISAVFASDSKKKKAIEAE